MMHFRTRVRNFLFLVSIFQIKEIFDKIIFRLYSDTYSFGLQRISEGHTRLPETKIPLIVRPIRETDIPKIFDLKKPDLTKHDKECLVSRIQHLHANIPTCYVAVTLDQIPVFVEWLMGHEDNEKIRAHFNGIFPELPPGMMLLEDAYTVPEFRGRGIMTAMVARISEIGKESGASKIITFIERKNIPSLKASKRAGFYPYILRRERWFLFHRTLTFTPLPPGTPFPFDNEVIGRPKEYLHQ